MTEARILSLNVGQPAAMTYRNKEVISGIQKVPAKDGAFLTCLNFEGDRQADPVHHGGKDKAVCAYPYEHYAYWEKELGAPLRFGAFGENLTLAGVMEGDVCIGDVYEAGGAVIQLSQPRQPCYKLAVRYGVPDLPMRVQQTGYTGYYFRVLREGYVRSGDVLLLRRRHPLGITVAAANAAMHRDRSNVDLIRNILEVEALSDNWRRTFQKRLQGESEDAAARLNGPL
ncbi:MOSC domain-containing protein [Paenibacillus sp.]|uniref:MOSC domain-containing protein n=1 Tax=Paenibacillus sp. TaxID=58172 RepID=UPI002D321FBB|nr:MOSC domain-containing protein [Paenibacillus sp.]HZG84723.1 MOSC domain-containing protein [Paenibacillus sp.]